MHLSVISLKGLEFEGEINSLNLKTTSGEITVLDNHRPLITSLLPGKLKAIKKDGVIFTCDVVSGILEIGKDNKATVLAS